ncbi:MAG: HAMP domain-containing protein [Holophagaceae bacterium]|nr:HAMP domain-containing protein [Holophagaceae bacterium]
MFNVRGSLLSRLQWGFALGAFLMAGGMALFMEAALRRSLDAEDALVMEAQAQLVLREIGNPSPGPGAGAGPERVEWKVPGPPPRQSPGFPRLDEAGLPADGMREVEADGRMFLVARRPGGLLLAVDRTHEESLVGGFRRTLLLGVALSALAAALLGRYVAARGLAPLHRLADEAAAIRPGSLGHRLDPSAYPIELGEVVQRLNGALGRLEEAFDRLSGLAGELAHELRTPIQSLRSEAESLIRNGEGPPEALGSILEECDRLATQIEQMLFLAKAEDPGAELRRTGLPVRDLLLHVADFFEASAEEAGVTLEVAAEAQLTLDGDRSLLERALHNLVANALRHTPEGGRVTLAARREGGACLLSVLDTGRGVDPALKPRLGQRWTKGQGSRGLGLGLAIVRSIARLHGGDVAILEATGTGTEVRMDIPDLKKT